MRWTPSPGPSDLSTPRMTPHEAPDLPASICLGGICVRAVASSVGHTAGRSQAMLTIREMAVEDMSDVRKLLAQLGYDLGPSEVRRRYEAVAQAADHALFVADIEGRVIG